MKTVVTQGQNEFKALDDKEIRQLEEIVQDTFDRFGEHSLMER